MKIKDFKITEIRGPLHVDEFKFSPDEIFLGYMNTLTRAENKNISTRAEIKNTICNIFIHHVFLMKAIAKKVSSNKMLNFHNYYHKILLR